MGADRALRHGARRQHRTYHGSEAGTRGAAHGLVLAAGHCRRRPRCAADRARLPARVSRRVAREHRIGDRERAGRDDPRAARRRGLSRADQPSTAQSACCCACSASRCCSAEFGAAFAAARRNRGARRNRRVSLYKQCREFRVLCSRSLPVKSSLSSSSTRPVRPARPARPESAKKHALRAAAHRPNSAAVVTAGHTPIVRDATIPSRGAR